MIGGGWVATYEDITERRQAESQIAYMAHHDALTDLANRILFREEMERALADQPPRGGTLGVHCLDLDRFKDVNDTLGHAAGDRLLFGGASALRRLRARSDTVARLGGDEFAIIQLEFRAGTRSAAPLPPGVEADRREPFDIDGHEVSYRRQRRHRAARRTADDAPITLLKHADMALYRAKGGGRGTFRFFEPEMDAPAAGSRRALELRPAPGAA